MKRIFSFVRRNVNPNKIWNAVKWIIRILFNVWFFASVAMVVLGWIMTFAAPNPNPVWPALFVLGFIFGCLWVICALLAAIAFRRPVH